MLSFLPFPPSLSSCHSCQFFGPKMTNSTTLGMVNILNMMMMVAGVLNFAVPQRTPSSENLAIQRFFGVPSLVCCFDESSTSLEYRALLVLQHSEDSQEVWLLLCMQGAYIRVPLACSSGGFADESYCYIAPSAKKVHHG